MNNFVLSYNPFTASPTLGQIDNHVRVDRFIEQFWQPFPGTYLLKSNHAQFYLNESLKGLFENTAFLLVQFDRNFASGQLPQEIWNWINFGTVPVLAPPPPPVPPANALKGIGATIDTSRK